jgi:hypothetical protein
MDTDEERSEGRSGLLFRRLLNGDWQTRTITYFRIKTEKERSKKFHLPNRHLRPPVLTPSPIQNQPFRPPDPRRRRPDGKAFACRGKPRLKRQ